MTYSKMKFSVIVFILMFTFVLTGCSQIYQRVSGKLVRNNLELQSIQSIEFEAPYNVVFASSLSVLQDLGYTVLTADSVTGFMTASSPKSQEMTLFRGWVMKNRKVTAFIETMPSAKIRVRLNFVDEEESSALTGMKGASVIPIENQSLYQDTFERIQKAIFVRSNI